MNYKAIFRISHAWMNSRNRNIWNVKFTLLAPSDANFLPFFWKNKMKSFCLFLLCLRALLKHHIRRCWPLKVQKHSFIAILKFDNWGKRRQTEFTWILFKVVSPHFEVNFFFHLVVDPIFETIKMNNPASSFTIARIDQWIFLGCFVRKTNFTGALQLSFLMEDELLCSVDFLKIKRFQFLRIFYLKNNKLDPA